MRFLLLVALLLGGCGGAQRGVSTYLRQLSPFQVGLREFQGEMQGIGRRPVGERAVAYQELAGRVRARGTELGKLHPPPPAADLQRDFQDLYGILAEYLETAAHSVGPDDPPLKAVAARWQAALARAQGDMDKL